MGFTEKDDDFDPFKRDHPEKPAETMATKPLPPCDIEPQLIGTVWKHWKNEKHYLITGFEFDSTKECWVIGHKNTNDDHFTRTPDDFFAQARDGIPRFTPVRADQFPDCDFYYYKPRGKWKYHGVGKFPHEDTAVRPMTHDDIFKANKGMPGISSDGKDMTVVIIPRNYCTAKFAYPRIILVAHQED